MLPYSLAYKCDREPSECVKTSNYMLKVSLSVVINAFKPGAFNVRQRIGAGGSAQTVKGTGTLTPMVNFAYGGAFMPRYAKQFGGRSQPRV